MIAYNVTWKLGPLGQDLSIFFIIIRKVDYFSLLGKLLAFCTALSMILVCSLDRVRVITMLAGIGNRVKIWAITRGERFAIFSPSSEAGS